MHHIQTLPPLEAFLWGLLTATAALTLFALLCALALYAWYRLTELSLDIDQLGNLDPKTP